MRRLIPVGLVLASLGLLFALSCGGGGGTTVPNPGGDDPGRGGDQDGDDLPVFDPGATRPFFEAGQTDPDSEDVDAVFLGDRAINWDRLNLVHLGGADSITVDLASEITIEDFLNSLTYRVEIIPEPAEVEPDPVNPGADKIVLSQAILSQVGRVEPVNLSEGIVRYRSNEGTLSQFTRSSLTAVVRPGQLYRANIVAAHAETDEVEKHSVYMAPDAFQFISSSRVLEGFDVDMDTENLVREVRVGDQSLLFRDSVLELLRLGQEDTVTVVLNTNVNPELFVSTLRYELRIHNLTRGSFTILDQDDLAINGTFTIPTGVDPITREFNNVIIWKLNAGATLADLTGASLGDELELEFFLVSGQIANGDRLTFRDKVFRALFIRA